jgi:hypothetical protein
LAAATIERDSLNKTDTNKHNIPITNNNSVINNTKPNEPNITNTSNEPISTKELLLKSFKLKN